MRNNTKLFRASTVWITCGLIFFVVWSETTLAKKSSSSMPPKPGNPIVDLQEQINALEQRVSELEGITSAPQEFSVNCNEGEKIADVLTQVNYTKGPVTITINGVCQESLTIYRDNIKIRGKYPNDGLMPGSEWFILNLIGSRRTQIENLTLTGGGTALNAASGATFEAWGLHVKDASAGVHLSYEASGILWNSIIENCERGIVTWGSGTLYVNGGEVKDSSTFGVQAAGNSYISLSGGFKVTGSDAQAVFAGGGSIEIQNAIVEKNQSSGVWAMDGGSISISGTNTKIRDNEFGGVVAWSGATVNMRDGVEVSNNQWHGVVGEYGGVVGVGDGTIIDGNRDAGIYLRGGSVAHIGDSVISNSGWDGILINDTSLATLSGGNEIRYNGGHGISCQPPPAVAQIAGVPGTVLDNESDPQINCPATP